MDLAERSEQVLSRVREMRAIQVTPANGAVQAKPENDVTLDRELAGLHTAIPMRWLTQQDLTPGQSYTGYLYNSGFGKYVNTDSDQTWLWAAESSIGDAICWTLGLDGLGNLVVSTQIGGSTQYLNWRNSTGACKLYGSYDQMTVPGWASSNQFSILVPDYSQFIGCWSTTDNELYVRGDVAYTWWQFYCFDNAAFSEDDRLIYSAYMKEFDS